MKSKSGITWFKAGLKGLQDRLGGIKPQTNAPSPLVSRCARYRDGFLNRIVPWEKIDDASWDKFPYHIDKRDKNLLVECVAAGLKPHYGNRLDSSHGRFLLETMSGTEVYRCRLVRTLARQFQVPLLELQTHDLPPCEHMEGIPDNENENENKIVYGKAVGQLLMREGDRVKYIGPSMSIKVNKNRMLSAGQRGEAREVRGDKVGVTFYTSDEKGSEPPLHWLDAKHVVRDNDALTHDCYLAMEVLCEVLESHKSIIVYFPDPFSWLSSASSESNRAQFFVNVKEMFDLLSERKVLICGQNKSVPESKHMERKLTGLKNGLTTTMGNKGDEMRKLFANAIYIVPPKNEDLFKSFSLQITIDSKKMTLRRNISEMHKVLKEHDIISDGLELVNPKGAADVEEIVLSARNHYLFSCHLPCVKDGRLHVPTESIKLAVTRLMEKKAAISRLKERKTKATKKSPTVSLKKSPEDLAKGNYEKSFVSAVVSPGDIGVKFDDVGALEDVKRVLQELVIYPIKRPKLFSRGNLLKPCKGLLLFGPPGTGKTLIAKAIATEAGANFISVTPSSLTGKWYGEEEKLTAALFSFARKLAPAIIFLDEVDALLRARNGDSEAEESRSMKNEFMAAWDGLTSNDSQGVLVLGATNRPFDLDDAVIRRMPRRIYVDLPDTNNRLKILKTILAKEDLEPGFCFERLANDTDGYSGSDLKNLCVAAAYRPVQELLDGENEGDISDEDATLRPLKLDDFILSKAKVGKSVAHDSSSLIELRKWNNQYGENFGSSAKKSPKDLATGEYETSFVSAVVSPGDIGVKFDDVGALEEVKTVLQELVIHPIKRPQLFSFGNLLKPCKGLLLFGPPGTGKTLIAKAIATEAGANFISVSPSSLMSKWYGEVEKNTRALFSFARKLTPVIIFLDEVDALLGARNGYSEHEASRRMKNEFMAAWDGLSSNDSQRILVLGATNRPFDLDDAVIRRMPRRIYVDLPDANNRLKILKIILSKENLEPGFCFEKLANDTDGYSGSDLKNLCVAAAYRPVQELLEKENKVSATDTSDEEAAPTLRPLKLDDFIRSKAKVGKSVAHDSSSLIELRKWNEQYGEGGSRRQSPFGF